MAYRKHLSSLQDDRLAREFPDTLDPRGGPAGGRLLPKFGVAVVLGLILAVIGDLTDSGPREDGIVSRHIDAPWTGPPQIGAIPDSPWGELSSDKARVSH